MSELNIVTGTFSYTGKYITRRLLAMGKTVRTLTGHPHRPNPFDQPVEVYPYNFDNLGELVRSLEGATTLYNTYWVRFPYREVTFERAVTNSITLLQAADQARVRKIVHLSITNPSEDSLLPYFRGKAIVEKVVLESGLSYAILRPTVIFGTEDILINNLAWLLRRLPFFAIPGTGDYRLQPVFVEDVAELAVTAAETDHSVVMDAAGPDVYTFEDLVRLIAKVIGSKAHFVHVPPGLALFLCKCVGYAVRDVILTREEVEGLMANLLVSESSPTGKTRLVDWLEQNADRVGIRYASELDRHFR